MSGEHLNKTARRVIAGLDAAANRPSSWTRTRPPEWPCPPSRSTTSGASTIDIATILDGEIYALYETGETLLRAGDTVINRGIKHAWSNRTDKPVTMVAVMLPATA